MVRTVIVDTGVLVALLSKRDQHHEWAVEQAMGHPLPWATSEAVLSETYHRISPSPCARKGLLEMIRRGALSFPFALPPSLGRMADLLEKFSDLPTSVADANLLLMAEHMPGAQIWTTDSDFLVYRMRGKKAPVVILPA
jgi:predicted nucleic acid-binding protein